MREITTHLQQFLMTRPRATLKHTITASDELVPTLVTVFKAYPTEDDDAAAAATAAPQHQNPPWMDPAVGNALARFRQWSNAACAQMVKGVAEIQGDLMRYRALQFFLVMA